MDLQYLLFLQNNVRSDALTPIMMGLSDIAISFWTLSIFFIVYWCINKKSGIFIFASFSLTYFINSIVKLSFCIYRPWIRDVNIIPAGNAIKTATGYSFPSGHTQIITSLFGSSAFLVWAKQRWLSIVLAIMILLVGFSRNYLGVHTPQDVIIGFILGILSINWAYKLLNPKEPNKNYDLKLTIHGIIIGIVALLYFSYKNYPIAYDANNQILVDPQKMIKDGFMSVGIWFALVLGWFIEKYYINFNTETSLINKSIRSIVGISTFFFFNSHLRLLLANTMPKHWIELIHWFIIMFYIFAIYPFIFNKIENIIKGKETK